MKSGQRKSLALWGDGVFRQFKEMGCKSKIIDYASSRRMRRLAKRKGATTNEIAAGREFVRLFVKNGGENQ